MCLFPNPNENHFGKAYKKGVKEFKCGACPECMRERASVWALRAVYESKAHVRSCMITLTYDQFRYDKRGNIVGEMPVNPDLRVNKDHVQKFIKRLRKKFGNGLKYIACAEYGSTTHRAHYHCIIFGTDFPDKVPYKLSKRGNQIYYSHTLKKLWGHGICTVDSVNVHSAAARYCTKYCAKKRSNDTFMLFSQKLGYTHLMRDFNGRSYMVEGHEYPVPKFVWQQRITDKYKGGPVPFDYHYVNRDLDRDPLCLKYFGAKMLRDNYYMIRDADPEYQAYCSFWKHRQEMYEKARPPVKQRIYALETGKYGTYKNLALDCWTKREVLGIPAVAPQSNCVSRYYRWKYDVECTNRSIDFFLALSKQICKNLENERELSHLSEATRLLKTSDTISPKELKKKFKRYQDIHPIQLTFL